ncbi:salicylate synthase [Rhodococcus maanshanensis]|uniref:salicylate synthase n=1 Tax=Rhodococcus maanshanensis TaxID=183556 RepID=UPI0022B484E9|nr:salicylate synthase [Rhodococcus maanshanensis]MCZ4556781.1 salicylate synthase [Rhodococcus maanshanensis]
MTSAPISRAEYTHTVHPGRYDPIALAAAVAGSGLLSSYVVYERGHRWYIAGNPLGEVTVGPGWLRSTLGGERTEHWTGSPWPHVRAALCRTPVAGWRAYGWSTFELAHPAAADPARVLAHLMVPGVEMEVTGESVTIRSCGSTIGADLVSVVADSPQTAPEPVRVDRLDAAYLQGVERAVARIRDGALQKVILSRSVDVPFEVNMPATYAAGRRANTPARSFLLDLGGWQAAGFSPETVLEVDAAGLAATQPLAGTRARTGHTGTDRTLRAELLADPKEVFEHAASVKLAFDELATIGRPSTTRVSEFLAVKERGSVQHLGSRVETELDEACTSWDALTAVFPAITASGIPKSVACETIHELEDGPRGLYAGAVLMADDTGALDVALVLRAIYQRAGRAWLRAGAGVVAASTPSREHQETCEKFGSIAPHVVPAHR